MKVTITADLPEPSDPTHGFSSEEYDQIFDALTNAGCDDVEIKAVG